MNVVKVVNDTINLLLCVYVVISVIEFKSFNHINV